jgi:hypothetical protein
MITFPSTLVTANAADKCSITSPVTKATSAFASGVVTISLDTTATLVAGTVTVTCTGLTLAAKAVVTNGVEIKTSKDTVAAYVNTPAVGAITADAASALTLSKGVGATGTATIQFSTSTSITAHATANKVTLTFPAGHVAGATANKCAITSPTTAAGTSAYAANVITITLAAESTLAAGAVTVTCTDLTIVATPAFPATATTGLKIETNIDTEAAFVSVPAVGAVSVEFVSGSFTSFTGTLADNKDLTLTSSGDVWTVSSAPSVSCSVSSFTNAALVSTQAAATVSISVLNAAGGPVYTATDTKQAFPTTVAAPSPRTLYLPKAAGSSYKVACALAVISALLAFL